MYNIDGECGEYFLVERYESDVEEEGDHILLALSDRFLEEKDTNGVVSELYVQPKLEQNTM